MRLLFSVRETVDEKGKVAICAFLVNQLKLTRNPAPVPAFGLQPGQWPAAPRGLCL